MGQCMQGRTQLEPLQAKNAAQACERTVKPAAYPQQELGACAELGPGWLNMNP